AFKLWLGPLLAAIGFLVATSRGSRMQDARGSDFAERVNHAYEGELRTALRVLIVGIGALGAWATLVPLSAAGVVPGPLVVESNTKKVHHPGGGVVSEIRAHDGAHVAAGELVVRLDDTQARATRQLLGNQLNQIRMRIARLIAERDGARELRVPHDLSGLMN